MYKVEPSGETLGCSIHGMDLSKPFGKPELGFALQALANHGVVCFPKQSLDAAAQVAFSRQFGALEVHVSGAFQEPGHPEVMILSNIVEKGSRWAWPMPDRIGTPICRSARPLPSSTCCMP
jgi:taurine dioxygenase